MTARRVRRYHPPRICLPPRAGTPPHPAPPARSRPRGAPRARSPAPHMPYSPPQMHRATAHRDASRLSYCFLAARRLEANARRYRSHAIVHPPPAPRPDPRPRSRQPKPSQGAGAPLPSEEPGCSADRARPACRGLPWPAAAAGIARLRAVAGCSRMPHLQRRQRSVSLYLSWPRFDAKLGGAAAPAAPRWPPRAAVGRRVARVPPSDILTAPANAWSRVLVVSSVLCCRVYGQRVRHAALMVA